MTAYLERLMREHRKLDRKIDNGLAAIRQEEMKALKRLRLRLKDRITLLQQRAQSLRGPSVAS